MSILYLVSTPIGNLEDLTRRAERVLGACDRVLAEDTRRSGVLLKHLGLGKPLVSLHAHNEAARVERVLEWLDAGETLCLVSDAGTPLVSDPGERLVRGVVDAGHQVIPIPGPSAVLAALAGSGLPAAPFTFLGFVPRKGRERVETLSRIADAPDTTVCFESPERLVRLLDELAERVGEEGADTRRVAVARELTKVHEEFFRGTLSEAHRYYREGGVRGEITLVVEPAPSRNEPDAVDEAAARALARALMDEGSSPSRAAREVARRMGMPRNAAYALVQLEQDGE